MESYLRLKYRPAAIEPEGSIVKTNQTMSLAKKVKPKEPEPVPPLKLGRYRPPPMDPSFTQIRKVASVVTSKQEDKKYRSENIPDIFERVKMQEKYEIKLQNELNNKRYKKEIKKQFENKINEALSLIEENHDTVINWSNYEKIDSLSMKVIQNNKFKENEEINEYNVNTIDEESEDVKDIKRRIQLLKESTILKSRVTVLLYQRINLSQRILTSLSLLSGLNRVKRYYTDVLPWLLVGKLGLAKNYQRMLDLNISHIMNVTDDIENLLPDHFVYMRIQIEDNEDADIGKHLEEAAKFVKHVRDVHGRIFIHSMQGISRAPTIVIAYLMLYERISLADAFDYLRALRSSIRPNKHFLFQLAELEVKIGFGSSVIDRIEWDFFDFNMIKVKLSHRKSYGLLHTINQLYNQHNSIAIKVDYNPHKDN